jgi:predicted alpha/beta superfamily hydrolase
MLRRLLQSCAWLLACALGMALPGRAQVVLKITRLPANTPPTDTVFVAGSFNSWNPHDHTYALLRNADGTRQLSLPVGLGALEYKFTLGSWGRVELDARRQPLANRQASAGQRGELLHEVLNWDNQAPAAPKKSTASPQVRVLAESFVMPQLGGRPRRVWLYLPADYARQPRRRYPVLYLHDGQNVFDDATSFSGEWGVDEILDRLHASGQDPTGCIVVAVDNGGELRMDEYIPWLSTELRKGGQGGAYVDFLVNTLKPYIDAHYRTRPSAASTGIAGSSLGGLISFYAALRYPRVFGRVGVFSPAFWVCNDSLKAYVAAHPAAPTTRFYFVGGPQESETMLPLMAAWRDALRAGGVPAAHLRLRAPADGQHREWFWQREFPAAYQWLFEANGIKK